MAILMTDENRRPYNSKVDQYHGQIDINIDTIVDLILQGCWMSCGIKGQKKEWAFLVQSSIYCTIRRTMFDINYLMRQNFGDNSIPFDISKICDLIYNWLGAVREDAGGMFSVFIDSLIHMSDTTYESAKSLFRVMSKDKRAKYVFPEYTGKGALAKDKRDLSKKNTCYILVHLIHRVCSMFDHTSGEVIPSLKHITLLLGIKFIYWFVSPLFDSVLTRSEAKCLVSDEKKLTNVLNRVKCVDLNLLFEH